MVWKEKIKEETTAVKVTMVGATKAKKKLLELIGETGTWLTMLPGKLNGTLVNGGVVG